MVSAVLQVCLQDAFGEKTYDFPEIRTEGKYKYNELRDILFQLRIKHGVISDKDNGIFLNAEIYRDWLHCHYRYNAVKQKTGVSN